MDNAVAIASLWETTDDLFFYSSTICSTHVPRRIHIVINGWWIGAQTPTNENQIQVELIRRVPNV